MWHICSARGWEFWLAAEKGGDNFEVHDLSDLEMCNCWMDLDGNYNIVLMLKSRG